MTPQQADMVERIWTRASLGGYIPTEPGAEAGFRAILIEEVTRR